MIYTTGAYLLVLYLVPFVMMSVLNSFLARSLHKASTSANLLAQVWDLFLNTFCAVFGVFEVRIGSIPKRQELL